MHADLDFTGLLLNRREGHRAEIPRKTIPARLRALVALPVTAGPHLREQTNACSAHTRNAIGSSDIEISEPSKRMRFGLSSRIVSSDTGRRHTRSRLRRVSRA